MEILEAVAVITIDCPPVNALDADAYREATAALARCDRDDGVRAGVITGAGGRAFCAGTHLDDFTVAGGTDRVAQAALEFFTALSHRSTPMVGALNGPVVGGGAMIAAECDVLLATRNAYFRLPELSQGFPGAASHLKRLFPYFVVQRMLLCDESVPSERAFELGAVAEVVDDVESLRARAITVAGRIATLEPTAVRSAREIFRQPESDAALAGYRAELAELARTLSAPPTPGR